MNPVQPTTSITFDNTTLEVSKMSADVQQMVAYYDDWRQKEVELVSKLIMVRSALRDMQTQLIQNLQSDREETLKKAEALGIVPSVTGAETPTTEDKPNEVD